MNIRRSRSLTEDFRVFERHRKDWLVDHEGKFVVVHKSRVLGFYDDYAAGVRAGVESFGVESKFLVQQVYEEEPVFCSPRAFAPK